MSTAPVRDLADAATAVATQPATEPADSRQSVVLLDLNGVVISANAQALKMLELEESAVFGRHLSAFLSKPSAARMKNYFARALRGATVRCKAQLNGSSNLTVPMRIRLDVTGANCSLEASWEFADTDRKPAAPSGNDAAARQAAFETLFQAYLELQETNKQKTAMVAAATHELKTPLAVISGAAELLLGGGLGSLNQQQREIINLCQQNCRRLLNVVNSFLDYSAVERGKFSLRLETHDVHDLVADAARYWKRLAQTRGIRFEYGMAHDLPPIVCDRAKLQNVLNSLCDNALKFTPHGGEITLAVDLHFWERRLAAVLVDTERRGGQRPQVNGIRFSVSDNGPGIPQEYHQEIFEEYFQVPGSPSGGMGLGLAIARKIVSAHKGKIWVESREGKGTAFHFVIPFLQSGAAGPREV
jgi:signal transduction histidine kinase